MSDLKLFRLTSGVAAEIKGEASDLEKPLQNMIEANVETLLGVRFLATEYSTGKAHAGRIDTLGLDENMSPVILEYKRSLNENVINQGLFYFDWLMDHRAEFWKLVVERYGKETADAVDWTSPRLICIAGDFTKYDEHAVKQMGRNIELIRYRKFGPDLLLFELVNAVSAPAAGSPKTSTSPAAKTASASLTDKTFGDFIADGAPILAELDQAVREYIHSLGDDVQEKLTKKYVAYKKLRNFATVTVGKQTRLLLQLHLNPDAYPVPPEQGRDMRGIGMWGTGDLQLYIESWSDFERAKPLIQRSYEGG